MFLTNEIEIVRTDIPRGGFRSALFDFDGTLSLLREGWPQVMIPMMVEVLQETGSGETEEELQQLVEDFVMRLNGRQTIYQMIQLAEEVKKRGGAPLEPVEYKHRYHELLSQKIEGRLKSLRTGHMAPRDWTVPGSHRMLGELQARSLVLYLASGTDLQFVQEEMQLLGLTSFFEERVYGALDDYQNFSKKMIIEQMIQENHLQGEELLGFGDGFVEIEEIKRAGGVAIAVASDESGGEGVNDWKRKRLIEAGADIVIPHYRCREALLSYLLSPAS